MENKDTIDVSGLNQLSKTIFRNNKEKGFWDREMNIGELLMLITSELSEALEAHRKGRKAELAEFEMDIKRLGLSLSDFQNQENYHAIADNFKLHIKDSFEDEIADAIIRLFDLCGSLGMDIETHIKAKVMFNKGRPRLHGKKY